MNDGIDDYGIAIFKANHDINNWQVKKWNARLSTMSKQDQFKDETNICLYIQYYY